MKLFNKWSVNGKTFLSIAAVTAMCLGYVNCGESVMSTAGLNSLSSDAQNSGSDDQNASDKLSQQSSVINFKKNATATDWGHLVEVDANGDVYVTSTTYNSNLSPANHTFDREKIEDGGCVVRTKSGTIVSNGNAFTTYRFSCLDLANGEIYFAHFAHFPDQGKWSAMVYHGGVTFQEFSARPAYEHLFQPTPDTGTSWGYIARKARDGSGKVDVINIWASPALNPITDSWNSVLESSGSCINAQRPGVILSNSMGFTVNHSTCLSGDGSNLSLSHWVAFADNSSSSTVQHGNRSLF